MKRSLHYFLHDMKFKNKFIITNLLLVLLPTLMVFIFLYGSLSNIIMDNTIESQQALVNQTAGTLEANVNQLSLAMDTISSNPFLSEATYSGDIFSYLKEQRSSIEEREFFSSINALIDQKFITAVRIYSPGDISSTENIYFNTIVTTDSSIQGSYWHGIFAGSPKRVSLLCPTFYLTDYEASVLGPLAYIRKFTNFSSPAKEDYYIAIYFSSDYIEEILSDNLTSTDSVFYIVNSRNSIIASTDEESLGTYLINYEDFPFTIGTSEKFLSSKILDQSIFMGYWDVDGTDWRLVAVTPASSVFTESHRVLFKTSLLYLVFVAMACALALLLSRSIANRLSKVVDKMNEQADNKFPATLETDTSKDEIGQLILCYNAMLNRINELMDEQFEISEKLKVSEVRALQAQINPHFLYNMLDMINWLAQSGKQKEVSTAVQTLSKFYKLTLSKKNVTTTIREELSHVELYVKLQNMRFEDKIDFIIDVPDDILDNEIPKLVLQPIVENSILHGIFEKETKSGTIVIMAWTEADDIIFTISDDGVGIPPEKLLTILNGEGPSKGTGSNIGIYNTHLRLQLLYGPAYGMHYRDSYPNGTEVEIRIPRSAPE